MTSNTQQHADFYDHLRALSEMPSRSGGEAPVRAYAQAALWPVATTMSVDKTGNLHVVRRGGRPGHVLLCAHMDKRLDRNCLATIAQDGTVDTSPSRWVELPLHELRLFAGDGDTFHPQEAFTIQDGRACLAADPQCLIACGYIFGLPRFQEQDGLLHGKFDDAMGVALILDALLGTDPAACPTISALCTVDEEIGLQGAEYAVGDGRVLDPPPEGVIVFDTSAAREPGSGIVLYEDCGGEREASRLRSRPLAEPLKQLARETNESLNVAPARRNDAFVFATQTALPTVALEVPILDMHTTVETVARADVERMRRFVKAFLTSGLFSESGTATA